MQAPEIAIINANTLSCMGLKSLLQAIIPVAVVRVFHSFAAFTDDTPDMYAHYFVSSQIYFEHTAFFLPRHPKAIVLVTGEGGPSLGRVPTLNTHLPEKELILSLQQLHQFGHAGHPHPKEKMDRTECELSAREIEVLILITRGLINKEIAEKLNISLTTVISHRKNIVEKLGIRSVSGLTIYAIMNGYVEADSI